MNNDNIAAKDILGHENFSIIRSENGKFKGLILNDKPPEQENGTPEQVETIKKRIAALDEVPVLPTREQVNAERDRRIEANFVFDGNPYQFDEMSKQRITGAATLAGFAIGKGAPEGYLRWADADNDFVFISAEDVFVPMDAQKCFAFGQAAARHETAHIFAASAIKKVMPEDYEDDKYWPET